MHLVKKLFVIPVFFMSVALLSAESPTSKKIGVLIFTKETHYNETLSGIMAQLEKEGFNEPKVTFIIKNAEGSKMKAAELAREFAVSGMDLVIVLGTSAAIAAVKEIRDVPIVFSMIYDPVESQIVRDWKSSGNNATGSSNKIPMSSVLEVLKKFASVKKLAVLYQPDEKNSVVQLKDIQNEQNNSQIKVVPVPVTTKDDVLLILPTIVGRADAVYLAGSSILGEMVSVIVDIATRANVITVTNLQERVKKGVLLGVCTNSYDVGLLAGEKAVKVLRGAQPSSVPVGMLKEFDILINMKTAKAGQFQISPDFMKTVTKTIE